MISFVVIGKNIETTIKICLDSIFETIRFNNIINYEVIFIDSKSCDKTLSIAKQYDKINIYQIKDKPNAAVARNLGFTKSKGQYIFFIDGDMKILAKTMSKLFNEKKGLKYPFISGDFIDSFKDNGKNIQKKYYNLTKNVFQNKVGGLFILERNLWEKVNGMRSCFRRSQDLDFALRMSNIGFPLLRVKDVLAYHYTEDYYSYKRFFKDLKNGNFLYQGLIYKYNLSNKYMYKEYLYKEITFFTLLLVFFTLIYFKTKFILLIYLFSLLGKLFYKKINKNHAFKLLQFIIHDINLLISIIFFWPSSHKKISYKKIK
tara:strand:+ start:10016 stop:10963 length:948 start_codon:yes stop_codon:yes gene_type:complete